MAERIDQRTNTASPARIVDLLAKLARNRQAKILADANAKEAKAAVTSLNGERAALFTQAEDEGIDKDAFKMLDDLRQRGVEDMNRLVENVFDLARKAEVPLWREPTGDRPQGDLWASPEERQQKLDAMEAATAEGEGCVAGLEGASISLNPHEAGSEKHAAWSRGWRIGDTDRFERAKTAPTKPPKVASTARKPGRPKKEATAAAEPKTRGRPPKKPKIDTAAPDADVAADAPPFSASGPVH